jgi:hypothetical protein
MLSDTSNAESGSDIDDFGPPFVQKVSDYGCLTPVREEVSLSLSLFLQFNLIFSILLLQTAFLVLFHCVHGTFQHIDALYLSLP